MAILGENSKPTKKQCTKWLRDVSPNGQKCPKGNVPNWTSKKRPSPNPYNISKIVCITITTVAIQEYLFNHVNLGLFLGLFSSFEI